MSKLPKKKHIELLNAEKARCSKTLAVEVLEMKEQIKLAKFSEDITEQQAKELLKELDKVDFMNITKTRKAGRRC